MATITWLVLGFLVASIVKLVAWDETPIGWVPVVAAGVVGAVGGGFLREVLFVTTDVARGFDLISLLMAIGGAAAGVYLYYLAIGRKRLVAARASHVMGQHRAA